MEAFSRLFHSLDEITSTEGKVQALLAYFESVPPGDAAWAAHVLLGRQKRLLITGRRLREICQESCPWPDWLFDACYRQVGDSAETISLLWRQHTPVSAPSPASARVPPERSLQDWMETHLPALAALQGADQAEAVRSCWRPLTPEQLLVVNKLLTGGLRIGVSEGLVIRALSRLSGLEEAILKHRLMGGFAPSSAAWQALLDPTESPAGGTAARPARVVGREFLGQEWLYQVQLEERRLWVRQPLATVVGRGDDCLLGLRPAVEPLLFPGGLPLAA